MSDQQDQSRTEEATPRRRERARSEGQVVFSSDLSAGIMLVVVSLLSVFSWKVITRIFSQPLIEACRNLRILDWSEGQTVLAASWFISHLLWSAGLIFIITTGTALLATQFQSGFTLTTELLTPKWEKISPATGWSRLLSLESLIRGGLAILKLVSSSVIVLFILQFSIKKYREEQSSFVVSEIPSTQMVFFYVILGLSGVTLFWGVLDYAIRWIRHEQKLKMSKQEIKDEQKDDQGDPQVKAKIRRAQQAAAKQRSLKVVPQATMVITNPTHYAVALKYQSGSMGAPKVIAKGTDEFARRIAETARKNGVPVFERKPLTRAIFAIADIGDEIPVDFYRAIAELLANVYRMKGNVA